jgi:general secretion pathway protein J
MDQRITSRRRREVKCRSAAFTLIELMVAMAIFAILSALAYGVLNQTLLNSEILTSRMERLQAIQKTVRILSDDFLQLAPRPVRRDIGEGFVASLTTDIQSVYAIELTRAGWSNLIVLPRSTLQRAAYRLEENELIRYHWNVLDRTLSNEPVVEVLLDEVDSISFRFLQSNNEWTEKWPPANLSGPSGFKQRPRAVEVVLALQGEGDISRLIEVAP